MKEEKKSGFPPFFALPCCSEIHSDFSSFGSTGVLKLIPESRKKCAALEAQATTLTRPHPGRISVVPVHTQSAGHQKNRVNKTCCKEIYNFTVKYASQLGCTKAVYAQAKVLHIHRTVKQTTSHPVYTLCQFIRKLIK